MQRNKIDWSKAPEGTTHFCTHPEAYIPWLKKADDDKMYWWAGFWVPYSDYKIAEEDLEASIAKENDEAIDQAMQGGDL